MSCPRTSGGGCDPNKGNPRRHDPGLRHLRYGARPDRQPGAADHSIPREQRLNDRRPCLLGSMALPSAGLAVPRPTAHAEPLRIPAGGPSYTASAWTSSTLPTPRSMTSWASGTNSVPSTTPSIEGLNRLKGHYRLVAQVLTAFDVELGPGMVKEIPD